MAAPEPAVAPVESEADAKAFIYFHESTNRLDAINPASSSCGLGQSLPCSKLATVCPDWRTDEACQDRYFSAYAMQRYGSWVNAKSFWQIHRWW